MLCDSKVYIYIMFIYCIKVLIRPSIVVLLQMIWQNLVNNFKVFDIYYHFVTYC